MPQTPQRTPDRSDDRTPDRARAGERATAEPRAGGPKLYGSLVGALLQAAPPRPVDKAYAHDVNAVMVRDKLTLAAAAAGTVVSLLFLGWEAVIEVTGSTVWKAPLGAGVTFSVGDITFPTALCTAVDASVGGGAQILGNFIPSPAGLFLPVWQQLGYASLAAAQAVGPKCELLLTTAGAAANGAIAWELQGADRI